MRTSSRVGRQEDFPVLARDVVFRRGHDGEIDAALVGADIERAFAVIDVIPVLLFARQEDGEVVLRAGGGEVAGFAGVFGIDFENEILAVARLADFDIVELILLVVEKVEVGRAEDVAEEFVAAFGDVVLGGQEERLVVGGPSHGSDAGGGIGESLSAAQILYLQAVLAEARVIDGVGQQIVVVGNDEAAEADELAILAQGVEIEQDLFGSVHGAFSPALYGVLFAFLGARVVEVIAAAGGHGEVGLLDVPQHLLVDGVAEGLQVSGHRRGVGVLCFQILDDLGARLLAQPEVRIDHGGAVPGFPVVIVRRNGRCRRLRTHGNGRKESERKKLAERCHRSRLQCRIWRRQVMYS